MSFEEIQSVWDSQQPLDDAVDVDLVDFPLLPACFSGPNIPAAPNCLD